MNERVKLTGNPDGGARIRDLPSPDRSGGERFTRAMPLAGALDAEAMTVNAIVATSTPVQRRDGRGPYLEVLDPRGLQFDKDDDLPLLADHRQTARETVGRAFGLTIDGSSVRAVLRLSMADDVEPLRQRIADGSLRAVSAGYSVQQWAETKTPDGTRTKTATRWRLLEVSLVPIPADRNARITRSLPMPFDLVTRTALIETLRSACNLPDNWGEDLTEEAVTDEEVRTAARETMLTRQAPRIRVNRSHEDPAAIITRAADAVAFRMAGGALPDASREFANMSLIELAKDSLQRSGVSTRGMGVDEVLQRAHSTSDYPLVVSNAAGKVALEAYQAAESPLKALARQRTLPNFKESTSIRLGEMGKLEPMTESGEFTATSRAEVGETMRLRTFGRRFDLTRQLQIDDDMNMFGDITRALGEAAAQTEAEEMVRLLTDPPEMSDGTTVFHASRGNLGIGLDYVLNVDGLSLARQAMRVVKGVDGRTIIGARPRYLVVGPEMETVAEQLLAVINPATVSDVNPFAQRLELVVEPRLSGDEWFLLADPAQVPSLQYGYLASAQGVQIQRREMWDTLGLSFRALLDFGAGWADWRGAFKAARD